MVAYEAATTRNVGSGGGLAKRVRERRETVKWDREGGKNAFIV